MARMLYKYFSSEVLELVFDRDGFCGVKCSYPQDYNDPFELFLGVDLSVPSHHLATYRDVVQELPQYPTTCFSKSPIVTPMWAHYAKDHSGFVLEFDTETMREHFKKIAIQDVRYRDAPDPSIAPLLERAAEIAKARYVYMLRSAVLVHAYFSKHTSWTYEQECRLVDQNNFSEDVAGNRILFIPIECVTSIIVGHKSTAPAVEGSRRIAEDNDLNWYHAVIGKSQGSPFLKDAAGQSFVFDSEGIKTAASICDSCSEPVAEGREFCPWCSITEEDNINAASRNPYRLLDHLGLLEGYVNDAGMVRKRNKVFSIEDAAPGA